MRSAFTTSLLLLACATSGLAWHAPPHRLITRAALNTLPAQARARLGAEASNLVELYCLYPDRYVEIQQFGFVHKSPGPKTQEELHVYCFRPDGEPLHSATWNREEDLGSLVYVFERIVSNLRDKHDAEAAKYMGTLSHWIADSLSPPHVCHARGACFLDSCACRAGELRSARCSRAIDSGVHVGCACSACHWNRTSECRGGSA